MKQTALARRLLLAAAFLPLPALAGVCDLSTALDLSCTINGAIFSDPASLANVGSGQINPFLTVQANGTESGFATDVPGTAALPLDDKRDNVAKFTNTLTEQNVGEIMQGSTAYFEFFLDANEPQSFPDSLLSLDSFTIDDTGSSNPFLVGRPTTLAQLAVLAGITNRYDLGSGNSVLIDTRNIAHGSGVGFDLQVLIPVSDFVGEPLTDRFTVATVFGLSGGTIPGSQAQDGFEEWSALKGSVAPPPPPPAVPEPGTILLLGVGLLGVALVRRKS